jgi:hypothetical protein
MNLLYRLLSAPLGQAQTQAESDASTSSSSPGGWLGTVQHSPSTRIVLAFNRLGFVRNSEPGYRAQRKGHGS